MCSQRNPLCWLLVLSCWDHQASDVPPGVHSVAGYPGYTWTLFLLSEDASLTEHCFPRANKKPSTNIPEIVEHSCLLCGSLCNGVQCYNALHRTGNALRPYQSPACWLITHILAGNLTLFSLFPPYISGSKYILVVTGCLYTVLFEARCRHRNDIFVWIFTVVFLLTSLLPVSFLLVYSFLS